MSFAKGNRGASNERLDRIKATTAGAPAAFKPKTAIDERMAQRLLDDAIVDAQDAKMMKLALIACGVLLLVAGLFTLPSLLR